jgi:hypothetical protein
MLMKPNAADGFTETCLVKYQVLKPGWVLIGHPKHGMSRHGYGIGDMFEVVEPRVQNLSCRHDPYERIPLKDGYYIAAHEEGMQVRQLIPPSSVTA